DRFAVIDQRDEALRLPVDFPRRAEAAEQRQHVAVFAGEHMRTNVHGIAAGLVVEAERAAARHSAGFEDAHPIAGVSQRHRCRQARDSPACNDDLVPHPDPAHPVSCISAAGRRCSNRWEPLRSFCMPEDWIQIIVPLGSAWLAGSLIGLERSYHGRPAGFRTHALVCIASALLMLATVHQSEWTEGLPVEAITTDPTRMAQGIMTGIGFLGAGVIIQE